MTCYKHRIYSSLFTFFPKMDLRKLITTQTDISLTLSHRVTTTESPTSNSVFSPLSLHVVLSLIAAGSSGSTRDELISYLKSSSSDELNKLSSELVELVFADGSGSGGPKLSFANGVWVDRSTPIKAGFKEVVEGLYKASCDQVDFVTAAGKVASEVNSWAETQTNGLIKDLLPPGSVDSTTRLIFTNALYFKGEWTEKFDSSKTKEDDFHLLDGTTSVKVPYMTSKKKQLLRTFDGFKVLSLPYKQGEDKRQFSMIFLLPETKDGLTSLSETVGSQPGFLNQHAPHEKVEVGNFKIPRFKISFGFESSKVLKGLGITSAFEGGLTEMVDSPEAHNLCVSSIFHKCFIEVNEVGTEAAAASAGVIALRSISVSEKVDFVADHPFMFVIREDMTGVVLFVGHVMNPLES